MAGISACRKGGDSGSACDEVQEQPQQPQQRAGVPALHERLLRPGVSATEAGTFVLSALPGFLVSGGGAPEGAPFQGESALQEVPGFLVFGVFGFFAVRGEDYVGLAVGGFDWKDVPSVGGDYVGGQEVDLVGAVGDVVGADGADVGIVAVEEGAFDLDAGEVALVF